MRRARGPMTATPPIWSAPWPWGRAPRCFSSGRRTCSRATRAARSRATASSARCSTCSAAASGAFCSCLRSSSGRPAPTRGKGASPTRCSGPREWPGNVRSIVQFFANWRHATLRAGEPIDLKEFLAREADGAADDVLVRRLTYTLLRRLERERRTIVGPVRKPADRLRAEVVRSPKLQKIIADMAGEGATSAPSSPSARWRCCARCRRRST